MEETLNSKKIINSINEDYISRNLDSSDLNTISIHCQELALYDINTQDKTKGVEYTNDKLYGPKTHIPESEGKETIANFDKSFLKFKSSFRITERIADFLIGEGTDAQIFLLQQDDQLGIAYKNKSGFMFSLDRISSITEMTDFKVKKGAFEAQGTGIKEQLKNNNQYGCPTKITIPYENNLEEFSRYKINKTNPEIELVTGIKDERVTLVMRFIENGVVDSNHYYDIFSPCPPNGTC